MLFRALPFLLVPTLVVGQRPLPVLDRTVLAMGTELRLHLAGPGSVAASSEAALAETVRIEAACSTWNPATSWSRLNASGGIPVVLDREWIDLLAQMKVWQARTGGAFDPVLMALMRTWGIRQGGISPTPMACAEARRASGAALLELDEKAGTARLTHPAAGVEEGGFLKGYALDRMRQVAGTPDGLLDFGGQLLAWGQPVTVSIADPRERQLPRLSFRLKNASLSSSGTSERGRHILDPRTGEPCPAWGSAAVVAPDALTADVLSTALYVMGPDAGLAWAERQGLAAAFLLNNGSIRMTAAFHALHPTHLSRAIR
jgi:thiamine biosynthesis lipoprotein